MGAGLQIHPEDAFGQQMLKNLEVNNCAGMTHHAASL